MKYLLLKNGQVTSQQKLISGDILIGNNRIMEVGRNIRVPSPDTLVLDVSKKYLLPGLIHYNCPFLRTEEKVQSSSSIYLALSHGATFLMDTIRFKKEKTFKDAVDLARESCKPIVADFGFHLGAASCSKISSNDLNYGFIHEGITSYYVKWKHIEKLKDGQLDHLLKLAAKFQLLIVCETNNIKQSLIADKPQFIKAYLSKMQTLLSILKDTGCPFLFIDIALEEEIELLFPTMPSGSSIFASVNLNCSNKLLKGRLGISHIETLWENQNVLLSPPNLIDTSSDVGFYIEHGKSPSFLLDIFGSMTDIPPALLTKVCDMYATRPAKIMGIYPQKGTIEPGADADIIIWNPIEPDRSKTSGSNTSLLRKDINSLIVNGEIITDDQQTGPNQLHGRFIPRNSLIPVNKVTFQDA